MATSEVGTVDPTADNKENYCETQDCNKPAKLQCPTCLKQGIKGSYFCSQDCFKGSWKVHKAIHKQKDTTGAKYNPWPHFQFTGPLRPFPKTPTRTVPAHIGRPDYADTGIPITEQLARQSCSIKVLSADEIAKMRTVCRLAREVLDEAGKAIKPGVTADEIDRIVHEASVERDCYPSPLNYYKFPKSCCVSVNEVICHGIPDTRPLEDGDICNVDVTVMYDGHHGDLNETFFVGKVSESRKHLVKTAYECMMKGIEIVKPGVRYREIGQAIQQHAQHHGCSVVRTYCGHGIHQLFHTAPNVPHYAKNKAIGVMKPGNTFTIEPMISQGTWKDVTWPDNWTAVTEDGKDSAQFEQTLLVTETGCDILTLRPEHDGKPHFMTQ
ncbi:methionine aminopeptidase 1-like isoform X2 [Dysidea avara]|uniref:methionine aminopeptidase 1-like isoform X2 n=1 Tax=Dysidea avara TaxID=196820 RepID=UPI00332C6FFD